MSLNVIKNDSTTFKNINLMMEKRGYSLKKNQQLYYIFENKENNICIPKTKIEYKSNNFSKIFTSFFDKNSDIKSDNPSKHYIILCNIRKNKTTENNNSILVKKSIELGKKMFENNKGRIELFSSTFFHYNILNHQFVPSFTKIQDTSLLEKQIIMSDKLPKMFLSDPISRYYDFKEGNIIKIHRKNQSIPLETITYRIIIMEPSIKINVFSSEIKSKLPKDKRIISYDEIIENEQNNFIKNNIEKILKSSLTDSINNTIIDYMNILTKNKKLQKWLKKSKNSEYIISKMKNGITEIEDIWNNIVLYLCTNNTDNYIDKLVKQYIDNEQTVSENIDFGNELKQSQHTTELLSIFKLHLNIVIEHITMIGLDYVNTNTDFDINRIIELIPSENKLYINSNCINTIINICEKVIKKSKKETINNIIDEEYEEKKSDNVDELYELDELDELELEETESQNNEIESIKYNNQNRGFIDIKEIEINIPKEFKLYPHQTNAIEFLKQQRKKDVGGVLYHNMGLGKTKTSCFYSIESIKSNGIVMAVVPKSTVSQWILEFTFVLKFLKNKDIKMYDMSFYDEKTLNKVMNKSDKKMIIITTMSQLRIINKNKELTNLKLNTVIFDEIHMLKNIINKNKQKKPLYLDVIKRIHTSLDKNGQIVGLTGTPVINEYQNLCSSMWITRILKDNIESTQETCYNRSNSEIINLFNKNSHKVSDTELKMADKPNEMYEIKTIKDNDFQIILSQNVYELNKLGAMSIKKKTPESFISYVSTRTMFRMLESSGIQSYIHPTQKENILNIITDKLKGNKQIDTSEFWIGLDETKQTILDKKIRNLNKTELKTFQGLVNLNKWIQNYHHQLKVNKSINYYDFKLEQKYDNIRLDIYNSVYSKIKNRLREELVNNYWKNKSDRTRDNDALNLNFGPCNINSLLEQCPTPKIIKIVNDIKKYIEEKQTYKGSNLIVVSSQYILTLQIIQKYFGIKMRIYHGGLNLLQRKNMIQNFHNGDFNILGLSKSSGGTGINIGKSLDGKTFVRTLFIVEPSESLSVDNQLKARIIRLGMGGSVKIIQYLYDSVSIDQNLYEKQQKHLIMYNTV